MGQGLQRQGSGLIMLEGADSLATARRRLAAAAYDLVVLDLGLGASALADFREFAPDAPLVTLARPAAAEDAADSLAAGAADCLSPAAIDCDGLVDRLRGAAARARLEAERAGGQRRTDTALEAAGDLAWHWEAGGQVWLQASDPATWGLQEARCRESVENLKLRLHPDDREQVLRRLREALDEEGGWQVEARLKVGGGGFRWCECRGRAWRNDKGVPVRAAGVVADVQRQRNAVRELDRARRQLRAVFDSDPVPHAIINASGFVTDCNRAWLGFDQAGCHAGARFGLGTQFMPEPGEAGAADGVAPETLARGIRQVLGGISEQFSCDYDAGDRHWRLRVFALMNPGIAGAVIRHEDVTSEWKDASGARVRLAEAESALAALPAAFFLLDGDFSVREANGLAAELATRPCVGRELMKCLAREDADAVAAALADVGGGASAAWRDAEARDDGTVRRWSVRPLPAAKAGSHRGFVATATDVSDLVRRGGDAALLAQAVRGAPVGMAMLDGEGSGATIRWANPAFAAMTGRQPEAVLGQPLGEFLASAGRVDEAALEKLLTAPAPDTRVNVHRYDGAAWELAAAPAGGALCLTAADVAGRERALDALTELRRRLQGALRGSDEGAWEWDESTGQGWISRQGLEILRLPPDMPPERFDEVIERIHRAERSQLRTRLRDASADGGQVEVQVRLDLPEEVWVEIRARAARGSRLLAGTLRDVTDACRARETLENRERRSALALRGAGLGTWSWSSRSRRIRADALTWQLHGAPGEGSRAGVRDWLRRVAPADRRRVLEAFSRSSGDQRIQVEYRLAGDERWLSLEGRRLEREADGYWRLDGTCRDVTGTRQAADAAERASGLSRATLDALPGLAARMDAEGRLTWTNRAWDQAFPDATTLVEALGRRRSAEWHARLRETLQGAAQRGPLVLPLEGRPRQMEAFWSAVDSGEALLLLQDLTDQRESENRLFQARKMESVGQLAGGTAREFNNLLGVVIGNLELLEAGAATDPAARRRVAAALGAAQQGAAVTDRLLAFARQQDAEPEPVDPAGFVRARGDLLGRQVGEGCTLEFVLADGAWPVEVDPAQLETALLQLVANAAEAMPGGGRLRISAGNRTLDAAAARQVLGPSAVPGDYVELAVEDQGPGIPPELAERVFDPFFTTRGSGRTGLGLSMVWGFAQQAGGRACVSKAPGGGARVGIFLPRGTTAARRSRKRAGAEPAEAVRRRAVLVEPDQALRETCAQMLDALGWEVREVSDGQSALESLEKAPADLLFTEVEPGDMDGTELARRATARQPGLRVLFGTGRGELVSPTARPLVAKPYRRDALATAIAGAMSGEAVDE